MPKGVQRPSIARTKDGVDSMRPQLAGAIRSGLEEYLPGMLKTIGRSGAGPKKRGGGDLRAALGGLRLLMDSYTQGGNDSEIFSLIKDLRKETKDDEEDESTWFDDPDGEDDALETLQGSIDEIVQG